MEKGSRERTIIKAERQHSEIDETKTTKTGPKSGRKTIYSKKKERNANSKRHEKSTGPLLQYATVNNVILIVSLLV